MPLKVIQDNTRSKLCEGRSQGIGFAFVKKVDDLTFQGIMPISPCKDYLNDVVYSEHSGNPYSAYGLKTDKKSIFNPGGFVIFSSCQEKRGSGNASFDKEVKALDTNIENMTKVLHEIEDFLGIKQKTDFKQVESNLILAEIAPEWVASTWMISAWSLIARNAIYSDGADWRKQLAKSPSYSDQCYIKSMLHHFDGFVKNGLPKQDFSSGTFWHNEGIASYNP